MPDTPPRWRVRYRAQAGDEIESLEYQAESMVTAYKLARAELDTKGIHNPFIVDVFDVEQQSAVVEAVPPVEAPSDTSRSPESADVDDGYTPISSSSNIVAIKYDPRALELRIRFKSGGLYAHDGVTHAVYNDLMTDVSAGAAYRRLIRGQYTARKLA